MAKKKVKVALTRSKVFNAMLKKYGDGDLDDAVHEIMSIKASRLNNEGIHAQLDFLADEAGIHWLNEYFLGGK